MTHVVAVVPARYRSSRFPGKPLAAIAGVPMIVRVLRNVATARTIERLVVATDDDRIAEVVRREGVEVVMTPPDIRSGTDRVWAAISALPCDIVVNVQADEPLLPGTVVDELVAVLERSPGFEIATPVVPWARAEALPGDIVTVARDGSGRALYFSRSVIPAGADPVWRHIGVYAFRRDALRRFVLAPPSDLEASERLEQLRALAEGLRIAAVPVDVLSHGVDRPGDVAVVERLLRGDAHQAGAGIRLVVMDADGVLTDGSISYPGESGQLMTFDVKDGYGIVSLIGAGIVVAVMSARDSPALRRRAAELGIAHVLTGVGDKALELERVCRELGVEMHEVCYVGDDVPDLQAMAMAGVSAAPADAAPAVREGATIKLTKAGGRGAVRELAELLLGRRDAG